MIHVQAEITLESDQRDAFLEEFHKLVPQVRQEEGCIKYTPCIDLATDIDGQPPVRENVVTVRETWESVPALKAHLVAPHMDTYRAKVQEMVQGVSLRIYEDA